MSHHVSWSQLPTRQQGSRASGPKPSGGLPRRPLSSSEDDEEVRPKKKKKRRIIDPDKGAAFANTQVSLPSPSYSATRPSLSQRPFPSTAPFRSNLPSTGRRRATLNLASDDIAREPPSASQAAERGVQQRKNTYPLSSSAPVGRSQNISRSPDKEPESPPQARSASSKRKFHS